LDQVLRALQFLKWSKDPSSFFKDVFNQDPYPYQRRVLKHILQNPKRILLMGAGGTGKTKLLACIALYYSVVKSKFDRYPYSIIIISGSRDQARNLYEYVRLAFKDNPILAEEVEGEPLMSITRLKNRSEILAVPNSLKAIQGKHCDIVIIDEAVLAGDFIIRDAFRIVAQSKKDLIILSGTPMEYNSLFVEMWEDEDKYPEWKRFHWSAKECPNISLEKYMEASKLPEDMFEVFWEGRPYAKETNILIPFSDLKQAVKGVKKIQYNPNGKPPVAGVDWGWTHKTAIVVVQEVNGIFNILYSAGWSREDFETIHDRIEQIYKQYHVQVIYADAEDVGENQRLEARGLNVVPIAFNQSKVQMQTRMKILFHQNKIRIPEENVDLVRQLRKYNWDTKKDDDYVDALMLALHKDPEENEYYYQIL